MPACLHPRPPARPPACLPACVCLLYPSPKHRRQNVKSDAAIWFGVRNCLHGRYLGRKDEAGEQVGGIGARQETGRAARTDGRTQGVSSLKHWKP